MTRRVARNRTDAPKMTAHHFEYLAYVIANTKWSAMGLEDSEIEALAGHFANHLKATNGRFDADTFIEAVMEK